MPWRELNESGDAGVPKLHHLKRAARAGLRVPETRWVAASDVPTTGPLALPSARGPWMLRSASPLEDGAAGSAAGRFHSELVPDGADGEALGDAARRVVASFGASGADTKRSGAVFAQPFVPAVRAGVAFFDGYHYERSWTPKDNFALTSGEERGVVERAGTVRGEAWSRWLARIADVFPELDVLDIEWAEDERGFVLLQARRAAFPVRRDPLVSYANHREILGPAPSPWIVSALDHAGRSALDYFGRSDPAVRGWKERYAWVAAGRAWMDFDAFFRLMDRWGLPRTVVTQGVGGAPEGPLDARPVWRRLFASAPRLVRLQLANLRTVSGMFRDLAAVDRAVRDSRDLRDLHAATVLGLETALRVNFALGGALAGVQRARRAIGIRSAARVVTGEMGREYEALRRVARDERGAALSAWLRRFGHRGPLESDPRHPRFDEMRAALEADLDTGAPRERERTARTGRGPLFWLERRRELFRDELMKSWRELRRRMLMEAERLTARDGLERADDVFFLTAEDLAEGSELAAAARAGRAGWEATRDLDLPHTARLSALTARERRQPAASAGPRMDSWEGIGLCGEAVTGRVRRADDLAALLADGASELGRDDILVVPALEPSWGVLFGRVGAVVAEIGGELSHASILLRELGTPAIVNCLGCYAALRDGERVRVDPKAGLLLRAPEGGGTAGSAA